MKAGRFFSVHYDIRHNPKIELLRDMGGGMAALGRWLALMSILYDSDGIYDYSVPMKRRFLCRELELEDGELDEFLNLCAACEIISEEALTMEHVACEGVCEQLAYKKRKSDAGKKGMKSRWTADKTKSDK